MLLNFGSGTVPTRCGGLYTGGLQFRATDFGSGTVPTRCGNLRSRGLQCKISCYRFRIWNCTDLLAVGGLHSEGLQSRDTISSDPLSYFK